jgi:ABC-type nitrate/sulfonate/bicarbonate transport system substrate-binding protein
LLQQPSHRKENRPLVVRFLRALAMGMRWLIDNRQAGDEFLAKEINLRPELALRGWGYYVDKRMWNRDLEVNVDGIKTIIRLYNEMNQSKGPLANPAKYEDPSYLKEALRGEKW